MKRTAIIVAAVLVCLVASGISPQQKYIEKWAAVAQREMQRSGVPASITLAQGLLESNSGQSELASRSNNHFGIKCHSDWSGGKVMHDAESGKECFRAYRTAEESFRDHSDFLRYQDRYKFLFELDPTDYKGWAKGLRKAGYATDSQYPAKLIRIIEENKLYVFDGDVPAASIPPTPKSIEAPKRIPAKYKEQFSFPMTRPVYTVNGVPCVYALEGETYESIAAANKLFVKEILHFNDLSASRPLEIGETVYLALKKPGTGKGLEKYVVGPDETVSLRDISQRFGVRLKSLRKRNSNVRTDSIPAGTTILLRK